MPAGAAAELGHELVVRRGTHSARLRSGGVLDRPQDLDQPRRASGRSSADCSVMKSALVALRRAGPGGCELAISCMLPWNSCVGAVDQHEVAVLERPVVVLAGVPQPGVDRAAAVRQLDLQIEVAVAVRPQLLLGGQKHLLHVLVVGKLADKATVVSWTWGRGREVGESRGQRGR